MSSWPYKLRLGAQRNITLKCHWLNANSTRSCLSQARVGERLTFKHVPSSLCFFGLLAWPRCSSRLSGIHKFTDVQKHLFWWIKGLESWATACPALSCPIPPLSWGCVKNMTLWMVWGRPNRWRDSEADYISDSANLQTCTVLRCSHSCLPA